MTAGLQPEMGPASRMGTPEEVAEVVEMVLRNRYLNGAVIDVDGGLGCM
jgi:3-oxoacyl-[acyl-carrier protein] reductase